MKRQLFVGINKKCCSILSYQLKSYFVTKSRGKIISERYIKVVIKKNDKNITRKIVKYKSTKAFASKDT